MNNNQLLTNLKAVKNDVRSKLQQYSNFENAYLLDFAKGKQLKRKISSKASKLLNVDKQIANVTAKCETNKAQLQAEQETIKKNIASIEESKRQITLQIQQTKTEISGIRAEIDKKKAKSKDLQRQIDMLNNDPPNPPNPPNNQSGNLMKRNKPTPSFKNQGKKVQKMVSTIEAMKPPPPMNPSFKNQGKKVQQMASNVKAMTPPPRPPTNSRSYRNVVAGTPAITKLTSQVNRVTNVGPNYKVPMQKMVNSSPKNGIGTKVLQTVKRPFQRKGAGSGGRSVLYNQKMKALKKTGKTKPMKKTGSGSWGSSGVGF